MSRRFVELVVRARRFVRRGARPAVTAPELRTARRTARRDIGGELTQFSFRLAFMIDLAYVGIGALGGAVVARASAPAASTAPRAAEPCRPDSSVAPVDTASGPNVTDTAPTAALPLGPDTASLLIPAPR